MNSPAEQGRAFWNVFKEAEQGLVGNRTERYVGFGSVNVAQE